VSLRSWKSQSNVEQLLRASRSDAPDELVNRLTNLIPSARSTFRMPRAAVAGGLSTLLLAGLAAVGGVSYAATSVAHIFHASNADLGTKMALAVRQHIAATNQYGGVTVSDNTKSAPTPASTAGSVQVAVPATGAGASTPVQVAVNWTPATFSSPVTVSVDPTPPSVTSTALLGGNGGNQLVQIVVTDPSGNPVTTLSSPLDVTFANPPAGFVPVISENGIDFKQVPKLDGTTLPCAGDSSVVVADCDGYYVDSFGTFHILTMHLTIFAVLYKANVTTSETGKTLPKAGSGLFGDPTRNHTGAPVLKQISTTIAPKPAASGTDLVPFAFSVDEQASTYISIFNSKNNAITIERNGSVVRGARYTGNPSTSLHFLVLRPGTINTDLRVPTTQLKTGQTYKIRVTAVDFDGQKVAQYVTFKA
jgi:hypothetical protein